MPSPPSVPDPSVPDPSAPRPPRPAAPPPAESGAGGQFIARAAAATAALTALGALLGLLRDQTIAHLFGAGGDTDAFLVSWTVPEFASTLLIEEAMALVLVPAFSLALARRAAAERSGGGGGEGQDPVRALLAATAPRLFLALAGTAALTAAAAPLLVRVLAPGLANPGLAVECTRLTALTLLTFGIAGYISAALRAHRTFGPPAAVHVAYNLGIIATIVLLHGLWGVRAAAAGVAVGSALMVLVQLPALWRRLPVRRDRGPHRTGRGRPAVPVDAGGPPAEPLRRPAALAGGAALLAPVAGFALCRQAQVLVERFIASSLPPGAISHLNYAQKVAQLPMVLSLMICTVTFPLVARAMADGQAEQARRRVERDLTLAGVVVLLGAAYVVAYAPQVIQLLFQRGAFDAADTAATASVMRVYAAGLLGHSLTGALVRPFFSTSRPIWYPTAAMAAGLLITVAAGTLAAPHWGARGIAAANALGISTTALLLLRGLGTRVVPVRARRVAADLGRLALAAGAAAAAGLAAAPLVPSPLLTALAGALVVPAVFTAVGLAVGAPEVPLLITAVRKRLRHAR